MRIFYSDEALIDTLLQIMAKPIWDGDLISKPARDEFVKRGWVKREDGGMNVLTAEGHLTIKALKLCRRPSPSERVANLKAAFAEHDIPWPY